MEILRGFRKQNLTKSMDIAISIGEAAALKGVTVETIRRWEKARRH